MISIQNLTLLLCVAFAYGASVRQANYGYPNSQTLTYFTQNRTYNDVDNELTVVNLKDDPSYPVATPQIEIGKLISEASQQIYEIFSKMELSEQSLQSLVQLVVPLVAVYFGSYSQLMVPLLSGIATVVIRSLLVQ